LALNTPNYLFHSENAAEIEEKIFLRNGMTILNSKNSNYSSHNTRNRYRRNQILNKAPADELLVGFESDEEAISKSFNDNIEITQGDIILPNNIDKYGLKRNKRRVIIHNQYGNPTRWPNRTIPYQFDTDANDILRNKIKSAIDIWHKYTCIRFEPYSPQKHIYHKSKVVIRNRGQ
jgi:hypothetical protein